MKKHKNLIFFILITLLWSGFLGMLKIFLRSSLKEDHRTLEEIAGYLSLGLTFSYLLGGALTYTFKKKPLSLISIIIIIGCLLRGFLTDFFPFDNFIWLLIGIGFSYGIRLTIKGIITTTEILESGRSETAVNGMINVALLIGLLIGSYGGFQAYNELENVGTIRIIGILGVIFLLTLFLTYDKNFKQHTIKSAINKSLPNLWNACKDFAVFLIPIGILRAVSTAIGQKMMEIGVDVMHKSPTKTIFIIVTGFAGGILGFILSNGIKHKKDIRSYILLVFFGLSTLAFPHILQQNENFLFINIYSTYLGVLFGVVTNLIESRFYHTIGDLNRKEFGSAAYGLISSIVLFGIMIAGNRVSKHRGIETSFSLFAISIFACLPFIRNINK